VMFNNSTKSRSWFGTCTKMKVLNLLMGSKFFLSKLILHSVKSFSCKHVSIYLVL